MSEKISKSQAARLWRVTPAMVTRYIGMGMPVLPDGKLEWSESNKWKLAHIVPQRSRNHVRREAIRTEAQAEPVESTSKVLKSADHFDLGYIQAREHLRERVPSLIANNGQSSTVEDRLAMFAEIDGLLGHWRWLETGQTDPVDLQAIDWSVFQSKATQARAAAIFEDTAKFFAA